MKCSGSPLYCRLDLLYLNARLKLTRRLGILLFITRPGYLPRYRYSSLCPVARNNDLHR
ncbi:hypothetical protein PATA110616_07405 [Paenibacillus tarimensis]